VPAELEPPFKFVHTTTFPHLPFADNSFDLITDGSVFPHIADLADMWLLELGRILRQGGRMFISIHDRNYISQIMQREEPWATEMAEFIRSFDREHHVLESDFAMFTIWRTPGIGTTGQAQVFYDADYLRQHWGQFFKVRAITPAGHGTHTAAVLSK
jgi:SAM-dependent methyltransferase